MSSEEELQPLAEVKRQKERRPYRVKPRHKSRCEQIHFFATPAEARQMKLLAEIHEMSLTNLIITRVLGSEEGL